MELSCARAGILNSARQSETARRNFNADLKGIPKGKMRLLREAEGTEHCEAGVPRVTARRAELYNPVRRAVNDFGLRERDSGREESAKAADDEIVAIGTVQAQHVRDDRAFCGVDDLADTQERFALGNTE